MAAVLAASAHLIETSTALLELSGQEQEQVLDLLAELHRLVAEHGLVVARHTLDVWPLGYADGLSREELLDMTARYQVMRTYNGSLSTDPRSKRLVEVIGTGAYKPLPPEGMQRVL